MKRILSSRFWLIVTLGLLVATSLARPQLEDDKMLDHKISEFQITEAPTSLVLQRLANTSNVPIGIEAVPEKTGQVRTIDVKLKGATVRSILNHVVEKDTQYNWREAGPAINVFPKHAKDPILETVVARYEVHDVNKEEAIRALENSVEVKRILKRGSLRNRTLKSLPGDSGQGLLRFSLNLKHSSVRNILNAIMLESKSKNWLFFRYGSPRQSFSLTVR